jgi:hypothetical protein
LFELRQGQGNDGATLGAYGQVVEHLVALMRGQRLLEECADLVSVWVVRGLEMLAHGVSSAAVGDV